MARLFTIEEANALIPTVERLLTRVRELKRQLDSLRERFEQVQTHVQGNGHAHAAELAGEQTEAERALDELNRVIGEITALGCEVKDLDEGLADFPHEREGRVVYLCWRLGEPMIGWWHEVQAGFAGRQPL